LPTTAGAVLVALTSAVGGAVGTGVAPHAARVPAAAMAPPATLATFRKSRRESFFSSDISSSSFIFSFGLCDLNAKSSDLPITFLIYHPLSGTLESP
jgi:hypothetical protein